MVFIVQHFQGVANSKTAYSDYTVQCEDSINLPSWVFVLFNCRFPLTPTTTPTFGHLFAGSLYSPTVPPPSPPSNCVREAQNFVKNKKMGTRVHTAQKSCGHCKTHTPRKWHEHRKSMTSCLMSLNAGATSLKP